jgi:outer membrane protein assembly factor BamB
MRIALFSTFITLQIASTVQADDWPQWLGPQRDGIWRENGVIDKFPADGPKRLWRTTIGAGYSGPAVSAGRVFVTDRVLDNDTTLQRSGFEKPTAAGVERILCLDEKSGEIIWKHEYPSVYKNLQYASGPRATPTVDGERVYALGAMGDLICLSVANGEVIWKKHFLSDYNARLPIWGFSGHPLVDGEKLICITGGDENRLVIAFDKKTGNELWTSQSLSETDVGYSAPMIYEFDGRRTLVIWHGRAVIGLDPETGKRYWSYPFVTRSALTAPTPRMLVNNRLFVTAFYEGAVMLQIHSDESPTVVWKGKGRSEQPDQSDTLHSIMPTPFIVDDHIYGVCSYGELRCLRADTGQRVWFSRKPTVGTPTNEGKPTRWGNAFLVRHEDRFLLFNEQGELVIAKLTPQGYHEIDRASVLEPTNRMAGRPVVWSHPSFANRKMIARNDKEIVCYDLAK